MHDTRLSGLSDSLYIYILTGFPLFVDDVLCSVQDPMQFNYIMFIYTESPIILTLSCLALTLYLCLCGVTHPRRVSRNFEQLHAIWCSLHCGQLFGLLVNIRLHDIIIFICWFLLLCAGLLAVYIAGHILHAYSNWNAVFMLSSLVSFFGGCTFMIFGSAKRAL